MGELAGRDPAALKNAHIVRAFRDGDPWTGELIEYVADKLGNVLASIHLSLGIERFVICGGFALALGESYRDQLVAAADAATWDSGKDWNAMIELGSNDDARLDFAPDRGQVAGTRGYGVCRGCHRSYALPIK